MRQRDETELLGLSAQSVTSGERWKGEAILYLGDNSNVVSWLGGKILKNRYARHLLRVFRCLRTV